MSVFLVRPKLGQSSALGDNVYAFYEKDDALKFIQEIENFDNCEYEWIECINGKLQSNNIVKMEGKK